MSGSRRDSTRGSVAASRRCPSCGWPLADCCCSKRLEEIAPPPEKIVARLRLEKKGRGGKSVTVIDGLPRNRRLVQTLTSELKRACAVGGASGDGVVELQGDQRERVRSLLAARGISVKG